MPESRDQRLARLENLRKMRDKYLEQARSAKANGQYGLAKKMETAAARVRARMDEL